MVVCHLVRVADAPGAYRTARGLQRSPRPRNGLIVRSLGNVEARIDPMSDLHGQRSGGATGPHPDSWLEPHPGAASSPPPIATTAATGGALRADAGWILPIRLQAQAKPSCRSSRFPSSQTSFAGKCGRDRPCSVSRTAPAPASPRRPALGYSEAAQGAGLANPRHPRPDSAARPASDVGAGMRQRSPRRRPGVRSPREGRPVDILELHLVRPCNCSSPTHPMPAICRRTMLKPDVDGLHSAGSISPR